MAVSDGAHNGAHGQAVEVVVDKDQDAQGKGGQRGAHTGLDVLLRPAAESSGAAGGVDQGNDDAQDNQEQEDTGVIRNGGDEAVVEGGIQGGDGCKVGAEQSAHQHADEQGGVSLLGNEGQNDGQDGGHQRPESTVHFDVPPIKKVMNKAGAVHDTNNFLTRQLSAFATVRRILSGSPAIPAQENRYPSAMTPFTPRFLPLRGSYS